MLAFQRQCNEVSELSDDIPKWWGKGVPEFAKKISLDVLKLTLKLTLTQLQRRTFIGSLEILIGLDDEKSREFGKIFAKDELLLNSLLDTFIDPVPPFDENSKDIVWDDMLRVFSNWIQDGEFASILKQNPRSKDFYIKLIDLITNSQKQIIRELCFLMIQNSMIQLPNYVLKCIPNLIMVLQLSSVSPVREPSEKMFATGTLFNLCSLLGQETKKLIALSVQIPVMNITNQGIQVCKDPCPYVIQLIRVGCDATADFNLVMRIGELIKEGKAEDIQEIMGLMEKYQNYRSSLLDLAFIMQNYIPDAVEIWNKSLSNAMTRFSKYFVSKVQQEESKLPDNYENIPEDAILPIWLFAMARSSNKNIAERALGLAYATRDFISDEAQQWFYGEVKPKIMKTGSGMVAAFRICPEAHKYVKQIAEYLLWCKPDDQRTIITSKSGIESKVSAGDTTSNIRMMRKSIRRMCTNKDCSDRDAPLEIIRCFICKNTPYCSEKCRIEHRSEHSCNCIPTEWSKETHKYYSKEMRDQVFTMMSIWTTRKKDCKISRLDINVLYKIFKILTIPEKKTITINPRKVAGVDMMR